VREVGALHQKRRQIFDRLIVGIGRPNQFR
jgi:hypothetical protein